MEFILTVENIIAGYGQVRILQGVSIEVKKGEIVSIIGPNGAGKSTLMKSVFGLVKISGGKINFDSEDITGNKPHQIVRKGMCYVPQDDNIFPSLTIKENLDMGAFVRKDDYKESINEVYRIFPLLQDMKDKKAGDLSGGQQKMVAIGIAMMHNPKLLLLDEPSAGLAPNLVDEIMQKIQIINKEGVSILMVEQNAKRALSISDRGYVLATGKNEFEDTGKNLLSNPDIGKLYLGE